MSSLVAGHSQKLWVRGTSIDAGHQPGSLAAGVRLAWSAGAQNFKVVLLEADAHSVEAQVALMGGWFEVMVHDDLVFAETMMADRAECLRGTEVRYRGNPAGSAEPGFTGGALLTRFDEVVPGDVVWGWTEGQVQVFDTLTTDRFTELTDARTTAEVVVADRNRLVAVISRDPEALIERRLVAGRGQKLASHAWLIGEHPAAVRTPANV